MTIEELCKKYSHFVLSMAIPRLLYHGMAKLYELENIDDETAKTIAADSNDEASAKLFSPDLQVMILRCAIDMAHMDNIEVLKYIKTMMPFWNIHTHQGNIVSFTDRKTGETYCDLTLDKELGQDDKDILVNKVREKINMQHSSYEAAIKEALDELGYAWKCSGTITDDEVSI